MTLHRREIHASDVLRKWLHIEEGGLRQKARYFHSVVKERCKKNRIHALVDHCGDIVTNPDAIRSSITHFYQNLLGRGTDSLKGIDLQAMRAGPQLTMSQAQDLIKPVSKANIDDAIKDIDESKSPGLDGFSSQFFNVAWNIIKEDVYSAIFSVL